MINLARLGLLSGGGGLGLIIAVNAVAALRRSVRLPATVLGIGLIIAAVVLLATWTAGARRGLASGLLFGGAGLIGIYAAIVITLGFVLGSVSGDDATERTIAAYWVGAALTIVLAVSVAVLGAQVRAGRWGTSHMSARSYP